ncbi:MAG: response regulator [Candidatus Sumerlaeia bacterium]
MSGTINKQEETKLSQSDYYVLIAEDEENVLASTGAILEEEGCRVKLVRDSAEALKAIEQANGKDQPFDVLLADYKMPGNEDLELLQEIQEETPDLPVILMTGYPSLQSAIQSIQVHVFDYLTKPLDIDRMIQRVCEAAEWSRMRKKIESQREELRIREAQYRLIVETANEGILWIDRRGCTTMVNQKMADMLGYKAEEMTGFPLGLYMDEEWKAVMEALMEHRKQGISEQHDFKFRRKDGSDLWTIVSASPIIDYDGEFQGALGMVTDITDRKNTEELHERLEKRLCNIQKHESLARLAGSVAHHLNNHLQCILGNSELVRDEILISEMAREYLDEIDKAGQSAISLSRSLLDCSGHGSFFREEINITAFIQKIMPTLHATVPGNIQLSLDMEEGLEPIQGDKRQIKQALLNVVQNAAESMEDKSGKIYISIHSMYCSYGYLQDVLSIKNGKPGMYACISVADQGCGIAPEIRDKIFDPFFSTKMVGRGLGLAAVLGILRNHRGGVKVYSEVKNGTTIRLFFPLYLSLNKKPDKSNIKPDVQALKGRLVLLVDDDVNVLKVTRRMLQNLGVNTSVATGAKQAIGRIHASVEPFDAVILDRTLTDGEGVDLYDRISEIMPYVPIVVGSGHSEAEVREYFKDREIEGYLQKPYQSQDLLNLLYQVFINR